MSELKLVYPSPAYAEDISALRQELFDAHDMDDFAGCGGLKKFDDPLEWIEHCKLYHDPETCPAGKAPSDVYLTVRESDNRIVGVINLRHSIENNPVLSTWGGHIGYSVRPGERGKGYGREQLRLCLKRAKEIGLEKVLITCHPDNPASRNTILANGGVFESEITAEGEPVQRFWVQLSNI